MFVTAIVVVAGCLLANIALMIIALKTIVETALIKGLRAADPVLRKVQSDQYKQLVALPLIAAIVGALVATSLSLWTEYPPWEPHNRNGVALALFGIAVIIGTAGPIWIQISYSDPKKLDIAWRIDKLKAGVSTLDSKADIIKMIDKDKAAIIKKLSGKGIWFRVLLALVAASDLSLLTIGFARNGASLRPFLALAICAAIVFGGLSARYWLRPKTLRSLLADLDSYRGEASTLPVTPLSWREDVTNHRGTHRLWMAVGGLIVGAALARLGAQRKRGEPEG